MSDDYVIRMAVAIALAALVMYTLVGKIGFKPTKTKIIMPLVFAVLFSILVIALRSDMIEQEKIAEEIASDNPLASQEMYEIAVKSFTYAIESSILEDGKTLVEALQDPHTNHISNKIREYESQKE